MSVAAARMNPVVNIRRRWTAAGARRSTNYVVLNTIVGVLIVIGLVMVLSASSVQSLTNYGSAWYFFERQLAWTALGVVAYVVTSRIDYRRWRQWTVPMLVISFVLLALVLIPGIGIEVYGSRRWLGAGWMRMQPVEPAKLALLVFAADLAARRHRQIHDWRCVLRPVLYVFIGLAFLVLLEPDMDSTVILALIAGTVLVVGGIRFRHLTTMGGLAVGLAAILAVAEPYRRARVFAYLHPWSDASNTGYQISQSLIALGSGGWIGVGLGNGRAKWMFLPNAHTDFIFAIIGEELGFVGCATVIALFTGFAYVGIRVAMRAPDRFGMLLAAGVTVWVTAQALVNIGAVVGMLPVSGIPLPFVSFGGSALVFTMAATGILANVARRT